MAKDTYSRDDDLINMDEFQKIEEQERKKKLLPSFKSLFKKKESESEQIPQKSSTDMQGRIDNVLMEVEKLAGKIEIEEEGTDALNERVIDLSSQIGELRSMLISKEKFFDKVDAKFSEMQELIKFINPEHIMADFQKLDERMLRLENSLEMYNEKMQRIVISVEKHDQFTEKLGDVTTLFKNVKKLKDYMDQISKIKLEMTHMTNKTQDMFSEIDEGLQEAHRLNSKVEAIYQSIEDLSTNQDTLQMKVKTFASKHDVIAIKKEIKKIHKLKDSLSEKGSDIVPKKELIENFTTKPKPEVQHSADELCTLVKNIKTLKNREEVDKSVVTLHSYIEQQLAKGFSNEKIITNLKSVGWSEAQINSCYL